jgi:hypothetical protein
MEYCLILIQGTLVRTKVHKKLGYNYNNKIRIFNLTFSIPSFNKYTLLYPFS